MWMVSTYMVYIGSIINYFCSDSKVELRKIKMQVSKWSIKGKSNIKYEPSLNWS